MTMKADMFKELEIPGTSLQSRYTTISRTGQLFYFLIVLGRTVGAQFSNLMGPGYWCKQRRDVKEVELVIQA